ncbi:MAG: DegT/DnrJ/EryC1/StrS family aminotransferase [Anaerolineaceae bacterium]|nr:DegT/DnrJ/EryC1/StrS family aminotransferase [Anaerolineaceae bacterium]
MNDKKLPRINMSSPDLTEAERQAVISVVETRYLSMGPQVRAFEAAFRDLFDFKHAIAVNSGTAGLHLCVRAAGIGAGDYVITTPFSFIASSNVLLYENAVPVFVDIDPETGNIDTRMAAAAAKDLQTGGAAAQRWLPRRGVAGGGVLKAILPVDVFGQPADYAALQAIADTSGIKLIEDSCEALGSTYKNRPAGALGDYGVFAFYPNKQITTGEGGMIVTNDDQAAEFMLALRNQGRAPDDTWLRHTYLGYNYRLDEMSAAIGAVQMTRLDDLLKAREQVADWYNQRLANVAGVEIPHILPETTRMSWFVYVIRLDSGVQRDTIAARLTERGVPVRPYFAPIHLQPFMMERFGCQPGDFPVTEDLGARGLALPFSGKMTEDEVERVCQTLQEAL